MPTEIDDLPEVLTPEQAGALLQFSPKAIRRMAIKGLIPGRKIGTGRGFWRFRKSELLAWLSSPREETPETETGGGGD